MWSENFDGFRSGDRSITLLKTIGHHEYRIDYESLPPLAIDRKPYSLPIHARRWMRGYYSA